MLCGAQWKILWYTSPYVSLSVMIIMEMSSLLGPQQKVLQVVAAAWRRMDSDVDSAAGGGR